MSLASVTIESPSIGQPLSPHGTAFTQLAPSKRHASSQEAGIIEVHGTPMSAHPDFASTDPREQTNLMPMGFSAVLIAARTWASIIAGVAAGFSMAPVGQLVIQRPHGTQASLS
jgi:hypothetical protein